MNIKNGSIVIGQVGKWEEKTVEINGFPLQVEVADNNIKRMQGLQYRNLPLKDTGMLFVFDSPLAEIKMHMINVMFPIDMIFVDPAGIVTQVYKAKPGEKDIKAENVLHVIEAPEGWCDKRGIGNGVSTNLEDKRTIDSLRLRANVDSLPVVIEIDKVKYELFSVNDKEHVISKDSKLVETVHSDDPITAFTSLMLCVFKDWSESLIEKDDDMKEIQNSFFKQMMKFFIGSPSITHKEELKRLCSIITGKQWK